MNKKEEINSEDLEIKKVAESKNRNTTNKILLIIMILLFALTLCISVYYIGIYNSSKFHGNEQTIEIKTKNANISIANNGLISQKLNNESFGENKELVIENINTIELKSNNNEESKTNFNVRYNILKNDFKLNNISTNKSEVLVKFSYSYDNENWTYINNVISTNTSNISPLIGNTYDIAGLVTNLSIATDFEITVKSHGKEKMYWRSETIFKKTNDSNEKEFDANFVIDYKTN